MPDQNDSYIGFLKDLLTTPLVKPESIRDTQNAIDNPTLDRSQLGAQLQGFAAGTLEGLRRQTSPLSLALMAAPAARTLFAARAAAPAVAATRAGRVADDAVEVSQLIRQSGLPQRAAITGPRAVKQVMPTASDVEKLTKPLGPLPKVLDEAAGVKQVTPTLEDVEGLTSVIKRLLKNEDGVLRIERGLPSNVFQAARPDRGGTMLDSVKVSSLRDTVDYLRKVRQALAEKGDDFALEEVDELLAGANANLAKFTKNIN